MPEYTVPVRPPIPARLADELAKRILFAAEDISDFSLVRGDEGVHAVCVSTTRAADVDELTRKIAEVADNDVRPQRATKSQEVWRSSQAAHPHAAVFEEMLARGTVTRSGEGQFGFARPFTDVLAYLDATFRDLAADRFGAEERSYPSLIRTDVLTRSGYVASFPQFLLYAGRLHGDADVYREFLGRIEGAGDGASRAEAGAAAGRAFQEFGTHAGYVLSPAVCYHVYQQHADTELPSAGLAVSAVGTCFRHESQYHRSLERLWEFTMRETVFIGEAEAVLQRRQDMMEAVWEIVEELGLPGHCESASDPFFLNARAAQKVWSQRALNLKYELMLPVGPDRSVAAVSFNVHGQTLGEAFGLRHGAKAASTACVAVGLERLAYAFLCQHGLDPDGWPAPVREAATPLQRPVLR